jgi:hypothetical protein
MTEYIRRLRKAGVIELSKRGLFVANFFVLPKKNGEARLVTDYSYQVQRQRIPFTSPYYIKLDLRNTFFNIPIHFKSRHITTFNYGGPTGASQGLEQGHAFLQKKGNLKKYI